MTNGTGVGAYTGINTGRILGDLTRIPLVGACGLGTEGQYGSTADADNVSRVAFGGTSGLRNVFECGLGVSTLRVVVLVVIGGGRFDGRASASDEKHRHNEQQAQKRQKPFVFHNVFLSCLKFMRARFENPHTDMAIISYYYKECKGISK